MRGGRGAFVYLTALLTLLVACGVSERTLADAEKRMNKLNEMGVPDSALSQAKVYFYEAKEAKRKNNGGAAKKAISTMNELLADLEAQYSKKFEDIQPVIDSIRTVANNKKQEFSGSQLHKVDSTLAVIDSLESINMVLEAHGVGKDLLEWLPLLERDEEIAKKLRKKIPGEWVCTNITKSSENPRINAVEKKIFTFYKNGKAKLVESKNGQSGPYLKEDWQFISEGSYNIAGDTIVLKIERFASIKQDFERMHMEDNGKKRYWKKEEGETYDSTITDGSQDRFIIYDDLVEDFKMVKNF
jgi:hypothetical protein